MTLSNPWDLIKPYVEAMSLDEMARVELPTIIIDPPFHGEQVGWDDAEGLEDV